MRFENYETASPEVKSQLARVTALFSRVFGENLIGLYLHGSMALSCFTREGSDLDLLAALSRAPSLSEKLALAEGVLALNRNPCPLEISAIYESQWKPWRHPTPCCYHFSDYWEARTRARLSGETDDLYVLDREFTDADIACHARLTRQCGIALIGAPIASAIPEVPEADFIDSLTRDIEEYDFHAYSPESFASNVLILARVWSYLEEKRILTKYEGGVWAAGRVPTEFRQILLDALAARYGGKRFAPADEAALERMRRYIIAQIQAFAPRQARPDPGR